MTQVTLDKAIVEDLISSKLGVLKGYIEEIINRWNETSTKEFLEKARTGQYPNAEDDAVELRQLLLDYQKLQNLLENL